MTGILRSSPVGSCSKQHTVCVVGDSHLAQAAFILLLSTDLDAHPSIWIYKKWRRKFETGHDLRTLKYHLKKSTPFTCWSHIFVNEWCSQNPNACLLLDVFGARIYFWLFLLIPLLESDWLVLGNFLSKYASDHYLPTMSFIWLRFIPFTTAFPSSTLLNSGTIS